MRVVNWKTSLGGIIAGASQVLVAVGINISPEVQGALLTIGLLIIGIFGKDSNVTGGTKANAGRDRLIESKS